MKVAVIAPPYPLEEAPAPPLGVAYVAAAFEASGAEVRIFDFIVSRYTPHKLAAMLERFAPDIVGITSVTLNYPQAASILAEAKVLRPQSLTVMGGPHVSFDAVNTLRDYPGIDVVVMGEGELTIGELMACGAEPRWFSRIRGLAYREQGAIRVNAPRGFVADIDTLPMPARHLLPLSRYRALGYPISIITSRGCPYSCIFCLGRRMVGNKIRQRRASLVVDEIEDILSYGIYRINIADDLFVSDREKVREVCGEIKKRGLNFAWSAFARVNTVDRETLEIMKDAGCDSISFGVESGNQEMLKRIRKGITLDQVRKAVAMCREAGIIVHCSFIVGLPGETRETLDETRRFAADLGAYYGYHLLAPFPGTTVRDEVETYDLQILTSDWTRYDANRAVVRTEALSAEEMNTFVDEFEGEINRQWVALIDGYHRGTNTPLDDLRVEGHFRTRLTYRLLSEDILEEHGVVKAEANDPEGKRALFAVVQKATGEEERLIDRTLVDFIERGYISSQRYGDRIVWHWTHNNRLRDFPL